MKLRNILILFMCIAAFTSCDDEDNNFGTTEEPIQIVSNDLVFSAEGQTATLQVLADGPIEASVSDAWCAATVSGSVVSVTVEANYSFEGRTALLTLTTGNARRVLPVQQQGMVLDMPFTTKGHYSPISGDEFTLRIEHSMPMTVETAASWIHPVVEGNTLRVTVDSNVGGHIRRGTVVCCCDQYKDTLRIAQFDMLNDVVGSYYMMGYYGGRDGAPAATRFDLVQRNDSLFMQWPQSDYASAKIHVMIDKTDCSISFPAYFTLVSDSRRTVTAAFYDTNGYVSTSAQARAVAYLNFSESAGYNSARLSMTGWPGHELEGFVILQNVLFSNSTLLQLATPVLMRVGPVGTVLE